MLIIIVCKQEISIKCTPKSVPVLTPRNMKQLRNLRFNQHQQTRIFHDALYNMHKLALDLSDLSGKFAPIQKYYYRNGQSAKGQS